jgi:hypothetical protein
MLAEFTWFGCLKSEAIPLGTVANDASRSAQVPDAYQRSLQSLRDEFNRDT